LNIKITNPVVFTQTPHAVALVCVCPFSNQLTMKGDPFHGMYCNYKL